VRLRFPDEWFPPLEIIYYVWICGEFLVMMTNRKRRALHDFIAGTVVIIRPPASATVTAPGLQGTTA